MQSRRFDITEKVSRKIHHHIAIDMKTEAFAGSYPEKASVLFVFNLFCGKHNEKHLFEFHLKLILF